MYEYSTVGNEEYIRTFPGSEIDGVTISETTVTSVYPRGMIFEMTATNEADNIEAVRIEVNYRSGEKRLVRADKINGIWMAHPWEDGDGIPAWVPFDFNWIIRDSDGIEVITERYAVEYWDPTREWTRIDLEAATIFVYDYEHIYSTEELARILNEVIVGTEPHRVAGFGRPISYEPIIVLYASDADYAETIGSGIGSPTVGGRALAVEGVVYLFWDAFITTPGFSGANECLWYSSDFNPGIVAIRQEPYEKFSLDNLLYSGIAHEVTHLYQGDFGLLLLRPAPDWWIEGQADFFSGSTGEWLPPEPRLRYLTTLDNTIPTLNGENISRETRQADGCLYLNYNVGFSFVNWYVNTYGLDTHAEVVRLLSENRMPLADALEAATGETFLDLENAWRTYIGFQPLTLADVDPAAAMDAAVNPVYQEGDTFTLPATPIQFPLKEAPGETAAPYAACFANTQVTVLRVGNLNGVNFYELDCLGLIGWAAEDTLP